MYDYANGHHLQGKRIFYGTRQRHHDAIHEEVDRDLSFIGTNPENAANFYIAVARGISAFQIARQPPRIVGKHSWNRLLAPIIDDR